MFLSSCTTLKNMNDEYTLRTYPTNLERAAILDRAKTESVPDASQKYRSWLLVDTQKNGKKIYVDTKGITHNRNTASGYVKTLKVDESYSIVNYKFFCADGYGRINFGDSYSADHKKNFQLIGFGPGESNDRRIYPYETPIAKTICSLGGFSHNPTNT